MGTEESVVENGCHFPCECQLLCAKGAELESRLVPRMAVHEQQKICQRLLEISSLLIKLMCVLQIRIVVCASLTISC